MKEQIEIIKRVFADMQEDRTLAINVLSDILDAHDGKTNSLQITVLPEHLEEKARKIVFEAAHIESQKSYWTYGIDGFDPYEGEFTDMQGAQEHADEAFAVQCDDEGVKQAEREIELVRYYLDDDTQDMRIIERHIGVVEYEYYHGDRAEHGTHYNGGGGVL